jgi:hypothetical protein
MLRLPRPKLPKWPQLLTPLGFLKWLQAVENDVRTPFTFVLLGTSLVGVGLGWVLHAGVGVAVAGAIVIGIGYMLGRE